jgi:hypothetical protein
MNPDLQNLIYAMAAIVGPLVGAGAGTYFGLRGAINGLKERSERMEHILTEVRDHARDAVQGLKVHDQMTDRRVAEIVSEVRAAR